MECLTARAAMTDSVPGTEIHTEYRQVFGMTVKRSISTDTAHTYGMVGDGSPDVLAPIHMLGCGRQVGLL